MYTFKSIGPQLLGGHVIKFLGIAEKCGILNSFLVSPGFRDSTASHGWQGAFTQSSGPQQGSGNPPKFTIDIYCLIPPKHDNLNLMIPAQPKRKIKENHGNAQRMWTKIEINFLNSLDSNESVRKSVHAKHV